jgi:hypothetical protein
MRVIGAIMACLAGASALLPAPATPAETALPRVLFSESFDDADLAARGWYDGKRFWIDSDAFAGKGCIEYEWTDATSPVQGSSPVRRLFEPTGEVAIRFYLKLSKGWGWSGRNYHPHLVHFLTTENSKWHGPAASHLTLYIEPVGGRLRLAAQDIQNAKMPHGLTQGPLRGGYNGTFYDSKEILFQDDRWHCVEAYFKLNTLDLERGRPNRDGIVRGWLDGQLVIEHTDVVLRSPDFPDMKFNQLLMAPYFGPGLLPHPQKLWIDELAVGTQRIGPVQARAGADVVLETPHARLAIGGNAAWRSLEDKAAARELIPEGARMPMAVVRHGGRSFSADSAAWRGETLAVGFAGTDTRLRYRVETAEDWFVFRLHAVEGTRPESLTLLQVPVGVTANVGRRLGAAWDDQTTACLMAANRQADCRAGAGSSATLSAATQDAPGPPLEGAAAALIVCPTHRFKGIARTASQVFGLLTNEHPGGAVRGNEFASASHFIFAEPAPVKDTRLVRGSYWFLSFGEADVDKVIDYCRRARIRQVMLNSGAWCVSPGHYLFHEGRYPRGRESLKATVARLHEHDILVGMHCYASKIAKRDPYVTPVPDRRLLRGVSAAWRPGDEPLEANLAEAVTAEQTEIRVNGDLRHWPGGPAVADRYWEGGIDKHKEVLLGDELVRYDRIGPEGTWDTLLGCKRGAWGTTASAHPAGAAASHLAVDGCIDGFIIDQETDLMDEVAERLAGIFNDCGFDMIYFDGGEDVDRRRFNYYVSNFQEQVMRRITKRPIVHMGTIMTHSLWHSFARSSTVDHYLNTLTGAIVAGRPPREWPTVKQHIDRSVDYMLSVRQDMIPGELGWFGIWPAGKRVYTVRLAPGEHEEYRALGCEEGPVALPSRDNARMTGELLSPEELRVAVEYDGLQLDEIEYLLAKSLGHDVPVSLQTGFAQMEAHPLTPAILDMVHLYEVLRLSDVIPFETREMLCEPGKDFALVRLRDDFVWAAVERVAPVGGDRQLRAFVGPVEGGSVAVIWHPAGEGRLVLPLDPKQLLLQDFDGKKMALESDSANAALPVGPFRSTLIGRGVGPDELRAALAAARLNLCEP